MSKRYQGGILGAGFNPLRAPNAPTIGTATGGCSSATVPFTAPACVGGSAITSYTGRSTPGNVAATASASPLTFSGLTNGTSYTFGVFALNSYGPSPISAFSNSVVPAVPDGTFAIFALGFCSPTRNKYTYSGDVNSVATSSATNFYIGAAAGNSTVGIFALGSFNVLRNKYTYSGDVNSTATSSTSATRGGAAAGNSTIGIFALGSANTVREKYTYSGDVSSSATSSTQNSLFGSAAGNSTVGIFALGQTGNCCYVTTRNKYTYSGDVNSAGGAATSASSQGSAAGNSTVGIFALGMKFNRYAFCPCFGLYPCTSPVNTRDKYTYSGCTVSSATAATLCSYGGAAAGNSTVGVFALGSNGTSRNKYTYAGDVNSTATASTANTLYGGAASNGTTGVNF
jgi:hypothetical protein